MVELASTIKSQRTSLFIMTRHSSEPEVILVFLLAQKRSLTVGKKKSRKSREICTQ